MDPAILTYAFYGLTAAAIYFAMFAAVIDDAGDWHGPMVGAMLLLSNCLSHWVVLGGDWPTSSAWFAVIDPPQIVAVLCLCWRRFAWWKVAIAAALFLQCIAHCWFWLTGLRHGFIYIATLDVFYLAQLVALTVGALIYLFTREPMPKRRRVARPWPW